MRIERYKCLWRSLIPDWGFFGSIQSSVQVYTEDSGGAWKQTLLPASRRWFHLLWNPAANLRHADEALVSRVLDEAATHGDLSRSVSYQLLVRTLDPKRGAWRFKISVDGEDALISPPFGVDS